MNIQQFGQLYQDLAKLLTGWSERLVRLPHATEIEVEVAGSAGKPWKGMGKSMDKGGCTPDSVPMVFICIYCVL